MHKDHPLPPTMKSIADWPNHTAPTGTGRRSSARNGETVPISVWERSGSGKQSEV